MGSPKPILLWEYERLGRVRLYFYDCEVVGASEVVEPGTPHALAVGDVSARLFEGKKADDYDDLELTIEPQQ